MRFVEMVMPAVCLVCFAASLDAQVNATGTLSGQITDPVGNAVVNARVRLIDQEAGIANTKFTATDGYYVFPLVKPGMYSIDVSATGFDVTARRDLVLQIQET